MEKSQKLLLFFEKYAIMLKNGMMYPCGNMSVNFVAFLKGKPQNFHGKSLAKRHGRPLGRVP
jgi:hypothetical protein